MWLLGRACRYTVIIVQPGDTISGIHRCGTLITLYHTLRMNNSGMLGQVSINILESPSLYHVLPTGSDVRGVLVFVSVPGAILTSILHVTTHRKLGEGSIGGWEYSGSNTSGVSLNGANRRNTPKHW